MGKRIIFVVLANYLVFGLISIQTNGFKVVEYELQVAASDKKHEYEKGEESDFFDAESEEKGYKGEKGYE